MRQYPGVKDKLLVNRAYRNLVEAYQRAAEYPVRLNWGSLASFAVNRRPSILWAVLQSKADGYKAKEDPIEVPKKATVLHYVDRQWCDECKTLARVLNNKLECCQKELNNDGTNQEK